MKNLVFVILALLLVNVTYAGDMGESQKADCSANVQSSRNQDVLPDAVVVKETAVATDSNDE